MFRRLALLLVMLVALAVLGAVPAAATLWNLSNDFSPFANPNGVWAFGSKSSLSEGLRLYNDAGRIPAHYGSAQFAG